MHAMDVEQCMSSPYDPCRQISELSESPALLLVDPTPNASQKDLPVNMYESELHVAPGGGPPVSVFVKATYSITVRWGLGLIRLGAVCVVECTGTYTL
jgi:hypothetical protein